MPNSRADACLDAITLARDPDRLRQATTESLLVAAAVLAKALVLAIDATGIKPQARASVAARIDSAGRAVGAELRARAAVMTVHNLADTLGQIWDSADEKGHKQPTTVNS